MSRPSTHKSDPERMRALTHPLRLELLDYLRDVREATATECAAQVGESVASCSFHLRTLGKYGFLERAERRGKEKPWRIVDLGPRVEAQVDPGVPGSIDAVQELAALIFSRDVDRVFRFLAQVVDEPQEWVDASTLVTSSFWATAEEMAEVSEQLQHLRERFAGRVADPAARPAGARRARLLATVNPDPEPKEAH